jgi:hypothetical protein
MAAGAVQPHSATTILMHAMTGRELVSLSIIGILPSFKSGKPQTMLAGCPTHESMTAVQAKSVLSLLG